MKAAFVVISFMMQINYGLGNWVIWADGSRLTSTVTDSENLGRYCHNALNAGIWTIWEQLVPGWSTTTPATTTVELATNSSSIDNVNFGNVMCIDDDGDGYAENGGAICGPADFNDNVEEGEAINPGAQEICDDQIDNNCDGLIDGQDSESCPAIDSSTTSSSIPS